MFKNLNHFFKDNVHIAVWIAIPISLIAVLISLDANTTSNESKNISTTAEDKAQKAELIATKAYKKTIEETYYNTVINLGIKLNIIKDPNTIKHKLNEFLKNHPKRVIPYLLFYDFFIKTDDKKSALIMLRKCINNTKPITQLDYKMLIMRLYKNNIRIDLQKIYIQDAYLNRTSDYSTKEHIEELYNKIIVNN